MIISIIPARGNSKRVPRKNLRNYPEGAKVSMPLINHTIAASLLSDSIGLTVVSTEDKEIKDVALKFGHSLTGEELRPIFRVQDRPEHLSLDSVQSHEVANHVFRVLCHETTAYENDPDGLVVILMPTSPKRTSKHISEAIEYFKVARLADPSIDTMVSGYMQRNFFWEVKNSGKKLGFVPPHFGQSVLKKYFKSFGGRWIKPWKHNPLARAGTQNGAHPEMFVENGAIYITTFKNMAAFGNYRAGKVIPYVMSLEDSIDIDNEKDFKQ